MFHVFDSVKGLLKIDSICIDNNIFRLHYKVTVIILIAFSLVVSSRQYIGDPIDCIVDEIPPHIMDTYCWISSTFTLRNSPGRIGENLVQPGVGNYVEGKDEVRYHKYYQWVCFVLFFQALFFYLPRFLWKNWEAGRMKILALDLICPMINDETKQNRLSLLRDYFRTNLHCQNLYAIQFIICEVLNFVNVICQIYFVDYFLDGEFSTYGLDVLTYTEMDLKQHRDPMTLVFPKVTKCTFYKYGPSGSVVKLDGLCVLPVNIVNEKIYVFLWFWFILLTILTALCLVYRFTIVMNLRLRLYLLHVRSRSPSQDVQILVEKYQLGDWFMLYQLSKNIDPLVFKDLVSMLAQDVSRKEVV